MFCSSDVGVFSPSGLLGVCSRPLFVFAGRPLRGGPGKLGRAGAAKGFLASETESRRTWRAMSGRSRAACMTRRQTFIPAGGARAGHHCQYTRFQELGNSTQSCRRQNCRLEKCSPARPESVEDGPVARRSPLLDDSCDLQQ